MPLTDAFIRVNKIDFNDMKLFLITAACSKHKDFVIRDTIGAIIGGSTTLLWAMPHLYAHRLGHRWRLNVMAIHSAMKAFDEYICHGGQFTSI